MIVLKEYIADALLAACEADPARKLPPSDVGLPAFELRVLAIHAARISALMKAVGERLLAAWGRE